MKRHWFHYLAAPSALAAGGVLTALSLLHGRDGAEGARADRYGRGVAFHDAHALERHAELRGDDLRIRGGVALAVVVRAEVGGNATIGRDAKLRRFVEAHARAHGARKTRGRDAR